MKTLHLYLPSPMREDAQSGGVNIVNKIAQAVAPASYALAFHGDSLEARARAKGDGLHLFHMQDPTGPNCLTLRRAYAYPFWQIEATNERWRFDVARARFDPESIDPDMARPFFRRWRARFLGENAVESTRDGFVFVPLQGHLRQHRSFQSMSPAAMIEAVVAQEPKRRIIATLHPNETYDAADIAMLDTLSQRFPRFQTIQADARALVQRCDYVATQNSSVALTGFFARKAAVLFAGADFHHITGSVPRDGIGMAFDAAQKRAPIVRYLYWFFHNHIINGGAPEAEAQIGARMRRHGWPV